MRRRRGRRAEAGKDYALDPAACTQLMREGLQYYHRYLSAFHLQKYDLVARDTERNLRLFAFVVQHATRQRDKIEFDRYRPYVVMMRARARALQCPGTGRFPAGAPGDRRRNRPDSPVPPRLSPGGSRGRMSGTWLPDPLAPRGGERPSLRPARTSRAATRNGDLPGGLRGSRPDPRPDQGTAKVDHRGEPKILTTACPAPSRPKTGMTLQAESGGVPDPGDPWIRPMQTRLVAGMNFRCSSALHESKFRARIMIVRFRSSGSSAMFEKERSFWRTNMKPVGSRYRPLEAPAARRSVAPT